MECLPDHRADYPVGIGAHIKHNRLHLIRIQLSICQHGFICEHIHDLTDQNPGLFIPGPAGTLQGNRIFFNDRRIDMRSLLYMYSCCLDLVDLSPGLYAEVI